MLRVNLAGVSCLVAGLAELSGWCLGLEVLFASFVGSLVLYWFDVVCFLRVCRGGGAVWDGWLTGFQGWLTMAGFWSRAV